MLHDCVGRIGCDRVGDGMSLVLRTAGTSAGACFERISYFGWVSTVDLTFWLIALRLRMLLIPNSTSNVSQISRGKTPAYPMMLLYCKEPPLSYFGHCLAAISVQGPVCQHRGLGHPVSGKSGDVNLVRRILAADTSPRLVLE